MRLERQVGGEPDHSKPVPCLQLRVFSVAGEQPSKGLWQGTCKKCAFLIEFPGGREPSIQRTGYRWDWRREHHLGMAWHWGWRNGLNQNDFSYHFYCSLPYSIVCVCAQLLSHVWLFVTPWTVACQCPLSMKISRQEYWSGLPFPTREDLLDSRIEPASRASSSLTGEFFTTAPPGKPTLFH